MLSLHPAGQRGKSSSRKSARIGLAIAGGGTIGGMYELGALRALDEALDGLDLTDLDSYVGVSSGAFLAAGLANRMSDRKSTRMNSSTYCATRMPSFVCIKNTQTKK